MVRCKDSAARESWLDGKQRWKPVPSSVVSKSSQHLENRWGKPVALPEIVVPGGETGGSV